MTRDAACLVALLTPPGRSAVATVLVVGANAAAVVDARFHPATGPSLAAKAFGQIVFGYWGEAPEPREELVVCRRDERRVEIHCHGGELAAARIVRSLLELGCRQASYAELSSSLGESSGEAAARIALASARTQRTAAILLDQYRGALRDELAAIDRQLFHDLASARQRLHALLAVSPIGLHSTSPWRVVLCGEPNVGKSSLINAMLGYRRAIVFDLPGTTRDVLTANAAINGWPMEFADTAGLRDALDPVESGGVQLAREQLRRADLTLHVLDLSAADRGSQANLKLPPQRTIRVGNKSDLPTHASAPRVDLRCSAATGDGVGDLLEAICDRLAPNPPPPGAAVPFSRQQVDAIHAAIQQVEAGDPAAASQCLARILRDWTPPPGPFQLADLQ